MTCEQTRDRLLDHLFDALPDDEAEAVREHLEGCEACRAALAAAEGECSIFAEAAREEGAGARLDLRRPAGWTRRLPLRRIAAAAAALLLAAGGLLLGRSYLRAPVLEAHPRLVVAGPKSWPVSEPAEFEVRAETVEGEGLPLDARARLLDGRGKELETFELQGSGPGRIRIPAEVAPPESRLLLEVTRGSTRARLGLLVEPRPALACVATDKPLYRPGETIRARVVVLDRFRLTPAPARRLDLVLTGPNDAPMGRRTVVTEDGVAAADFPVGSGSRGGDYRLSVESAHGEVGFRPRVVSVRDYRVPRLKTDLELDRRSYGPGGEGAAFLSVDRAEGGAAIDAGVRATLKSGDREIDLGEFTIGETGAVSIPFSVPTGTAGGDAVLTAVVSDGGNVEAATRTIPVSTGRLTAALLPEGGELVAGLPGRVYFRVRDSSGRAAELVADVVDGRGRTVATARTDVLGMGRFDLVPAAGESYRLVPRVPRDVALECEPAAAVANGVALATEAERYPAGGPISVALTSTMSGEHEVVATCRGTVIARTTADLVAGARKTVLLAPTADVGGVVRITVRDPEGRPRAERLVSREPARRLHVAVEPDRAAYAPGDRVTLSLRTTDAAGKPVPAVLGLSVAGDSVIALADDRKTAPMPLQFLLGLSVDELEDVSAFADGPGAAHATDLLLGTEGFRRFAPAGPGAADAAAPEIARFDNGAEVRRATRLELREVDERIERIALLLVSMLAAGTLVVLAIRYVVMRYVGAALAGALTVFVVVVATTGRGEDARPTHMATTGAAAMPDPAPGAEAVFVGAAPGDVVSGAKIDTYRRVYAFPGGGVAAERRDFSETLCFEPRLATDADGRAEVTFETSDSITRFRAIAEGFTSAGGLGRGEAVFANRLPLSVEPKLPAELSTGDVLEMPVAVANATSEDLDVSLFLTGPGALLANPGSPQRSVRVPADGRVRGRYRLHAGSGAGEVSLSLSASGPGPLGDLVTRKVRIVPRGYPIEVSKAGPTEDEATRIAVDLPPGMDRATLAGALTIYPNALTTLTDGLEAMLREPHGCFEQASSANYPNLLVLSLLEDARIPAPAAARRARRLLDDGYGLLTSYECSERGYEWFGKNPAHPALTAYGLLEFTDMARHRNVDPAMLDRTRRWLLDARDGRGSFEFPTGPGHHSWDAAPAVRDAYVVWSLVEAGAGEGLEAEIAAVAARAKTSDDPYLVALAALTLGHGDGADAAELVARLAGMQGDDGALRGAKTSITSSRGENLVVETTALAAMAFLRTPDRGSEAERAVRYLLSRRQNGGFGATQATILALRALTEEARRAATFEGEVGLTILVNNRVVANGHADSGAREPLDFSDAVLGALVPGRNEIEVLRHGDGRLPYALSLTYHSRVPPTDPDAAVGIETSLDRSEAAEGDTVGLTVTLTNREADAIPMVLARVGFPAGLTPRVERLRDLVAAGEIADFELRPREIVLYLEGMSASAKRTLALDLTADLPGEFEGPASSAYLFYTDDARTWSAPLRLRIH